MNRDISAFWSISSADLLNQLQTQLQGLTSKEAENRLAHFGPNLLKPKKDYRSFGLLLSQFKSPIILILLFATGVSVFLHDSVGASIIFVIVLISGLLGFWQEKGASDAVKKLLAIVQIKAITVRDGKSEEIPIEEVVPGDIVLLNAGDIIPGDSLILESKDLFVDEATLTGETYPAEKIAKVLSEQTPLSQRTNSLFMGTHVISGTAKAVVVHTAARTEFGKVSERLRLRPPETEFEHGIRHFGYFLMQVTLLLVMAIFAINVYLARPVLDSILFSLALAVGLTPQLLPAIISVNLAHGARLMAQKKVIVKRLSSIENFGSMNILCSDKTGTLTKGVVELNSFQNIEGEQSERVFLYAYLNAFYQTGFTNPIDQAILNHHQLKITNCQKLDEVPYDFIRKRLSILVLKDQERLMITKGTLQNVLSICSSAEKTDGTKVDLSTVTNSILKQHEELSNKGFRLIAIAYRDMELQLSITKDDEKNMVFLGLLVFFDPPKSGVAETISNLQQIGVSLKIITGDNRLVANYMGQKVGLSNKRILAGSDLLHMSDEALFKQVNDTDIFAELEPHHKERIILALKKTGNVVGFMGDGINDASALHASDVGISVDSAVDVAKEAADIVLLEKNLEVLIQGIKEGRKTFANTLKYVFMATSANFGNMFSMAGASLFLSFLPLLPKQILLMNLMTDFPEMTISTDSVDNKLLERPRRWDIKFIRNFMMTFGTLSSIFDYLTFGVLLLIMHAAIGEFRTAWFVESVISASLIVLVVRTRKPFFKSIPGKYLLVTTLLVVGAALALPYTPLSRIFGFVPLPPSLIGMLILIVVLYVVAAEITKKIFYRKVG